MKKFSGICAVSAAALSILFFSLILFSQSKIPDSITTVEDDIVIHGMFYANIDSEAVPAATGGSKRLKDAAEDVDFSLFGLFPVKTVSVTKTERNYVIPGGEIVGLRLQADGVMIVATQSFESEVGRCSPAANAGLLKGDIICSVNGKTVADNVSLVNEIDSSDGGMLVFEILRSGEKLLCNVTPARCSQTGKYKCGLWVRDSAAGIGTLTFYCPETRIFACLGHSVTDADTGQSVPLSGGELLSAGIIGINKGSSGSAGELNGVLGGEVLGDLILNDSTGVYGSLESPLDGEAIPLACCTEVHKGYAQILASVDSNPPKLYDAEIVSVAAEIDVPEKNFVIQITDTALLSLTGGIVQGMSGSPIIQDGMLAGAVTHVFLNDSERGYGIFAEHMYSSALSASQSSDNSVARDNAA